MWLFNRKKKEKEVVVRFVKTVKLTSSGQNEIMYHSEIGNLYVSGSINQNKELAEAFFDKFIALNGKVETKEVLKEAIITQ